MPRSAATAVQNNFSKGLITEATGMNFPENAATETFNCIYEQTGKVRRRLGFEVETDYDAEAYTSGHAVKHYLWRAVANVGTVTYLVRQNGPNVNFFLVTAGTAVSDNLVFTIDLDDYLSGMTPVTTVQATFAAGSGRLFIAHPQCEPLAVTYNDDLASLEITEVLIQIRDFVGVDDSLEIDEEPTTLSDEHEYNLKNQGWYYNVMARATGSNSDDSSILRNPITVWNEQRPGGVYPSNADVWWAYKRPWVGTPTLIELFSPGDTYTNITHSNTPAPKGHYIYDAFNIDRSTVSGVTGLTAETSGDARPSCVEFFAGRVFWGGVQSRKYGSKLYFSQIIERDEQFGRCYQNQDPTEEDAPDLLPSDGGVIVIPEVATVLYLKAKGSSLFVFASNGVWQISGSEGIGFRANDYSVTKVTDTPTLSASSFVSVDGNPVWINRTGIWTLTPGQMGQFEIQSLSDKTIKDLVQSIPDAHKPYITGAFNPKTRVIQWLFAQDDSLNLGEADRVLNFNTLSGAFYPWSVSAAGTALREIITLDAETVDTYFAYAIDIPSEGLTLAEEKNTNYVDWFGTDNSGDGYDYSSYGVVGYGVYGEGNKVFQSNYVTVHYEPVEDGSCYIQGQWEYSNTGSTGRWSSVQQVYSPTSSGDYDYETRKLKIRGQGKALQLRFKSLTGKPFTLAGWVVFVTGNGAV